MGFLERALAAEEECERQRARVAELEVRLRGLLRSDESLDLSTARQTEALLIELSDWLKENGSVLELLPPGFHARLDAQMNALAIVGRERGQPQSAFASAPRPKRAVDATTQIQAAVDEASGFTQQFQRELDMRVRHSLAQGMTPHVHFFKSG